MAQKTVQKSVTLKIAEPDSAPYIPADAVLSAGYINGLVQINLGAHDLRRDAKGAMEIVTVPCAHLRMTPRAVRDLITSLEETMDLMATNDENKITHAATPSKQ